MYDSYPVDSCENVDVDLWNIEAAAFRLLMAQSVRIYRNQTTCYPFTPSVFTPNREAPVSTDITGTPYKYWNWYVRDLYLRN